MRRPGPPPLTDARHGARLPAYPALSGRTLTGWASGSSARGGTQITPIWRAFGGKNSIKITAQIGGSRASSVMRTGHEE